MEAGEALIGDHGEIGLTRKQYRTRLERLKAANLISAKGGNRGTIARLMDTRVFDINASETHAHAAPIEGDTHEIR